MSIERPRLVDLAVEAVRIAASLPASAGNDPLALRKRCEAALGDFAAAASRAGHAPEAIDAARYALVALIDERAMSPTSAVRTAWLDQPLQLVLFDSFSAGEEFYRRLERCRHPRKPEDAEALEVFQTCLALGFRGMMGNEGQEATRRQLAEQAANEVLAVRGGLTEGLSPNGLFVAGSSAQRAAAQAPPRIWPLWAVPLGSAAALVLIWLITHAWVAAAAGRVVTELR